MVPWRSAETSTVSGLGMHWGPLAAMPSSYVKNSRQPGTFIKLPINPAFTGVVGGRTHANAQVSRCPVQGATPGRGLAS